MKPGSRHITAFLILLLSATGLYAQVNVRATVNRDQILIGEPISLTIEAYVPLGSQLSWAGNDSIPHFFVTNRSAVDTAENIDGKKISQEISVTSFDSGQWQMPPFEIIVNGQPYYTDSIPISVTYTPFNAADDYRDIKTIIEVENPAAKNVPLYLAIATIVALAALFYFIVRKRKPVVTEKKPVVPLLTPYEEAMLALKTLAKKYPEEEVKGFYSDLNDILRNYVSRQFGISTFERTNDELVFQLSKMNIPRESFLSLTQALRVSDFVKFAKYRPTVQDNEENLGVVKSSIDLLDKRVLSAV